MIILDSVVDYTRLDISRLTRHNPCNPSVIATDNGYACTVRGANYDLERTNLEYKFFYGSFEVPFPDTQNSYVVLDDELNILSHELIEDRHLRCSIYSLDGIEDLRLFMWKGEKWVIGNAISYPARGASIMLAKLKYGKLIDQKIMESPKQSIMEKNWMPWVNGGDLYFMYKPSGDLLHLQKELIVEKIDIDSPLKKWSGGSCIVNNNGNLYAIIHKRNKMEYFHALVEYSWDGDPIWVSKEFHFEQPGVEFCSGLAFKNDDIVVSYGINDSKAILLKMNFEQFKKAIS